MILPYVLAAGLALAFAVAAAGAHAAPRGDAVYVCHMAGKPPMRLNLTRHRFQFAGQAGELNEGLVFNFATRAGYRGTLDLGDPDRLHFARPPRVSGMATVANERADDRETRPARVTCSAANSLRRAPCEPSPPPSPLPPWRRLTQRRLTQPARSGAARSTSADLGSGGLPHRDAGLDCFRVRAEHKQRRHSDQAHARGRGRLLPRIRRKGYSRVHKGRAGEGASWRRP